MKKYMKRNQILVTALAIMVAVAGYLSFQEKKNENMQSTASKTEKEVEEVQLSEVEKDTQEYLMDLTSMESEEYAQAYDLEIDEESMDAVAAADFLETDMELLETSGEEPGEAVFTASTAVSTLSGAKLLKEQTRAKNKEMLLEIINNVNISEEAKTEAIAEMVEATKLAEKEMSAEILLEAKGFEDAVVSITGECADVCVVSESLTDSQRAQIEDIVSRKTETKPEDIVITNVW